jgi:hypothetical protein
VPDLGVPDEGFLAGFDSPDVFVSAGFDSVGLLSLFDSVDAAPELSPLFESEPASPPLDVEDAFRCAFLP